MHTAVSTADSPESNWPYGFTKRPDGFRARVDHYSAYPQKTDPSDPTDSYSRAVYLGSLKRDLTKADGDRMRGLRLLASMAKSTAARVVSVAEGLDKAAETVLGTLGSMDNLEQIVALANAYMLNPKGLQKGDPVEKGHTTHYLKHALIDLTSGDRARGTQSIQTVVNARIAHALSKPMTFTVWPRLLSYIEEVRGTRLETSGAELVKAVIIPRLAENLAMVSAFGIIIPVYNHKTECPIDLAPKTGGVVAAHLENTLAYSHTPGRDRNNKKSAEELGGWVAQTIDYSCANVFFTQGSEPTKTPTRENFETEAVVHQNGELSFTSSYFDPSAAPEEQVLLLVPKGDDHTLKCINEAGGEVMEIQRNLRTDCLWSLEALPHREYPFVPESMSPHFFTVSCGPTELPNVNEVSGGKFNTDQYPYTYAHNPRVYLEWTPWGSRKEEIPEEKTPAVIVY